MVAYIFLYNVVGIKSNLLNLKLHTGNSPFILIASEYCLEHLSPTNQECFDVIHEISRNFHQISFEEVESHLLQYINLYGAENIRLLSNEDSTHIVSARLRKKYGIPGYDINQLLPFVDKTVSKSKLSGIVRIPKFISFNKADYRGDPESYLETIVKQIEFPMFAKPIDLVSSIGTYYIPDLKTLQDVAIQILSQPYEFEIDEFIEGDLFHCDVISHHGEIKFFMACKYAFPLAKFSRGKPMGSIPVIDEKLLNRLEVFSKKILNHMGGFSSAFHLEMFLQKKSQELVFLEAAARTPGALVPNMYEIIFNMHLEELHYLAKMHLSYDLNIEKTPYYAGWITFPKVSGIVQAINMPQIDIRHKFINMVKVGDQLESAQSLLDSACSIVFWDESYQKLENTMEYLKNYEPLVLSPMIRK